MEEQELISELIQGMELTKQLKQHVNAKSPVATMDLLVHQILASYDKSFMILKWSGSAPPQQALAVTSALPESSVSINGSPQSDDFDKDNPESRYASKKRKTLPRWTDQVKVTSENMLEGSFDDGYSWRKYGQKDILGAKYPRSYYRCTYRSMHNCWATKQVQRSDEDPTIFEVTYRGEHTCSFENQTVRSPASPENKKQKPHDQTDNKSNVGQQPQEMLLNLKKGLRVDTECIDNATSAFSFPPASFAFMESENLNFSPSPLDNTGILGSFSPTFMSPATPELNYYSVSCQINNFSSAETSANNSPIMDLDFSLDSAELDPNFLFDIPGFFS